MSNEGHSWFPLPRRDAAVRERSQVPAPARSSTVGDAVVDCGLYDEGRRQGGRIALETALNQADACEDGFVWIGLHDATPRSSRRRLRTSSCRPRDLWGAAPELQTLRLALAAH